MAILSNNPNIGLRKSVDGYTYRHVNGHTVVSRKITTNSSSTDKQVAHRQAFVCLQRITTELGPYVEAGFSGATYNIRRRAFMNHNKELLNFMKQTYTDYGDISPLQIVLDALCSPLFLGHIVASEGAINSRSQFSWDDTGVPEGSILLPIRFEPKDKITLLFCLTYELAYKTYGIVRSCSFTLGSDGVGALSYPNILTFDRHTVPQLSSFTELPYGAEPYGACMAAVIYRDSTRSMSYFSLVE